MKKSIVCEGIKKTYGEGLAKAVALRGANFEAYSGELLMLAGPSGCGKTTLISIVSGIMQQDSGQCLIYGTDLNQLPDESKLEFRKENIGFVFQSFNLIPTLTAAENVSIPLILNGIEQKEAVEKASALLETVNLGHRLHALPSKMSGGEQQRVAICRGCIHRPRLIVCDEPTSALDHKTGEQVMQLFKDIALHHDTTLLIVTHDARIFSYADRILHLDDGRIAREESNNK
jgi:putative ABC transport system ATP-binding protein